MTYAVDPFTVAREISGVPRPPRCDGPPEQRRHHWVYYAHLTEGGTLVGFKCAHCGTRPQPGRLVDDMPYEKYKAMAHDAQKAHARRCTFQRPAAVVRPVDVGKGRKAPARRIR
jgi:hypothetical protein